MNSQVLSVITVICTLVTGIISAMVLRNQKLQDERHQTLKKQVDEQGSKLDKHADLIATAQNTMANCKTDCHREFVPSESFVRSEAYTRHKLDDLVKVISDLASSVRLAEKMPEIAGNIAREIAKQVNKNSGDTTNE